MNKSIAVKAGTFAVMIVGLFLVFRFLPVTEYLGRFLEQVQSLGVWGPVILAGAYVVATVAMASIS